MGTPAYRQNQRRNSGIYLGPTRGKSSPKNSRRACLCLDSDTYDVRCCKGALMQQGIGVIQSARATGGGGFDDGYDDGYDKVVNQ